MQTPNPDLFTQVHKGIRAALFAACHALGRAGSDRARSDESKRLLAEALRFVAHHGENEDLLLLPMLRERAPEVLAKMESAHQAIDAAARSLSARIARDEPEQLHLDACAFTALYLQHMDDEERTLEPLIRAAAPAGELATFGRRAVERTAPDDKAMMMRWMSS